MPIEVIVQLSNFWYPTLNKSNISAIPYYLGDARPW